MGNAVVAGAVVLRWRRRWSHEADSLIPDRTAGHKRLIEVNLGGGDDTLESRHVDLICTWGACAAAKVDAHPRTSLQTCFREVLPGLDGECTAAER